MKLLQNALSSFRKVGLEKEPVGIKYCFFRPGGMEHMAEGKNLSFCEMVVEAQQAKTPFYFSKNNNEACVGKILLGMEDMEPFAHSGQIGSRLEIFQEPRANYIFYQHVPKIEKGVINYVAFSSLEEVTFEPDLILISATVEQAEVIMRAMSYSTGEIFTSMTTPVMGCAWAFIYPYKTGKVNYLIPEMVHGMKGRQLFPKNSILVSIPYQWIPTVIDNLSEMKIELTSHARKEQYLAEFEGTITELMERSKNP